GGRCGHVGKISNEIIERRHVQLLQGIAGKRLDRDRHVLNVLRAALSGDGDLLDLVARRIRVGRAGRNRMSECAAAQNGGDRVRQLRVWMHGVSRFCLFEPFRRTLPLEHRCNIFFWAIGCCSSRTAIATESLVITDLTSREEYCTGSKAEGCLPCLRSGGRRPRQHRVTTRWSI